MVLLLAFQALAVLDIERGPVVDATFYKRVYKISNSNIIVLLNVSLTSSMEIG